jgi:hypothetical protein
MASLTGLAMSLSTRAAKSSFSAESADVKGVVSIFCMV